MKSLHFLPSYLEFNYTTKMVYLYRKLIERFSLNFGKELSKLRKNRRGKAIAMEDFRRQRDIYINGPI